LGGAPKGIPIGGPMAYGKGRLWVAAGNEYYGGDLVWSDPVLGRGTILRFSENDFLNEGGAFSVPQGPITGMAFGANLDTSLGDGDLLVFTPSATFAFNAPVDRTAWKDLEYPIQRFALLNFGSMNHESIVPVNGDLFFRATDGIRSLVYARRDFTEWGNTPVSRQVRRVLQFDTPAWLGEASSATFDNRLLMTVLPRVVDGRGTVHTGLAVMDFDLVAGMGRKLPPAWEGVWTGMPILRVQTLRVGLEERCFAWVLGNDSRIGLMEITRAGLFDFDGNDVAIEWSMECRSMTFNSPDALKRLELGELWYDRVAGNISSLVRFRPNENECWTEWGTVDDCALYKDCTVGDPCQNPRILKPAARSRIALPTPPQVPDPQTGRHTRDGFEFQVRLENTGRFRLKRLLLGALPAQQSAVGDTGKFACPPSQQADCQTGCVEIECAGYCSEPPDYGYILDNCVPPTITTQPESQEVILGEDAIFTVVAGGAGPWTYQWYKDGIAIPGAQSATLNLGPMTEDMAGEYTVTVSNFCGEIGSSVATLAVDRVPVAYILYANATTSIDGNVVMLWGMGIDGEGPIVAYEWESDLDGPIGSLDIIETSALSIGVHTIRFRVQDDAGQWSGWDTVTVEVVANVPDARWLQVGVGRLTVITEGDEAVQLGVGRLTILTEGEDAAQLGVARLTLITEV
jgi:hypothetical protein